MRINTISANYKINIEFCGSNFQFSVVEPKLLYSWKIANNGGDPLFPLLIARHTVRFQRNIVEMVICHWQGYVKLFNLDANCSKFHVFAILLIPKNKIKKHRRYRYSKKTVVLPTSANVFILKSSLCFVEHGHFATIQGVGLVICL